MNRGKSQVRSNKLCDTIGKRTLDKVSKISRTKKQHKQERTPKKQIIYNQINYDHLENIQVLTTMLSKRV